MHHRPKQYPGLPQDTANAAREVFITNLNKAIGDQLDTILNGVEFASLASSEGKSTSSTALLGMVTIMQYVEELPDARAAIATGKRMDWKYALHLPLHFPGLDPDILCEFRSKLIANSQSQLIIQQLLDNLSEARLLGSRGKQYVKASDVLFTVCSLNRLAKLIETVSLAIESLAVSQPEWFQRVAPPHWFSRYGSEALESLLPTRAELHASLANDIGADIHHLLAAIDRAQLPEIGNLPEIRALLKEWHEQFEEKSGKPRWRQLACARCTGVS